MRVEARAVRKRFGPVVALDGIGFEIPAGGRVALVGPNGSGKSTLNRILLGLLACEGEVRIDGRSPLAERVEIARRMAYVPQAPPGLGASVAELLRAVADLRGLERSALERVARRMDLDLGPLSSRPFRSLSGGTKQKLAIALAFAADARLLVLDEPTGSLDARSRERFFELCDEIDPAVTLVLCSHRLEEIRPLVDHVLYLEDGRLVYDGAAAAFLDACAASVLEVWTRGDAADGWLESRGFRRAPAGFWLRAVTQPEKMKLIAELAGIGGALANVNARDLERLDLSLLRGEAPRG